MATTQDGYWQVANKIFKNKLPKPHSAGLAGSLLALSGRLLL
jgi:hypothetical protein